VTKRQEAAALRILVFDDEAAVGRIVTRIATMSGLTASAVTDVAAFEAHVHHDAPDVIILDLQLEDTDGVTQLRWLADHKYTGALILVSGFDERVLNTARTVGLSLGLNLTDVLAKPLRLGDLEALFARLTPRKEPITPERLLEGIAAGELQLNFQPVVTRHSSQVLKFEALVRWNHPDNGPVPPSDFIPMAECDDGMIEALTDWVTGAVVEAYQILREDGLAVPIALNLAPRNLHDMNLPDRIEQRLRQGNMPAADLCLEMNETAIFSDPLRSMDILTRMRLKGMKLSIDNFGTGFSSLRLLRQMPFTEIKIDRSFIVDVTQSADSRAIVKAIRDVAKNMDMACVAQGVETAAAADFLEQAGIPTLQGYFIARPMPVREIPGWIRQWKAADSISAA
jgi:EAL domain-containing protein (putative c-di-GMP-specific phosphodiesterase class I)/ActR/RegA family two-component response regulator